MHLVTAPIASPDSTLPVIALHAPRRQLAKRIWRAAAEDGTEFGFDLASPLKHGDVIMSGPDRQYVVTQEPEPVLEVPLNMAPSAAAALGWAIGNLHVELSSEPHRLLAPDEPAVRQLLTRLQVAYAPVPAVFRPGRFARGNLPVHDLGPGHRH